MICFRAFFVIVIAALMGCIFWRLTSEATRLGVGAGLVVSAVAFFAAAVANATAVGGGFVFMPFFMSVYSLDSAVALKLSICTQAFGLSSGMLAWSRANIDSRILSLSLAFGCVGVLLGTMFFEAGPWIKPLFGYVSVLIGFLTLLLIFFLREGYGETHKTQVEICELSRVQLIGFSIICFVSGVITAWVSIGIGEVVALWMIILMKKKFGKSVSTGVASLAICSILGMLFYFGAGNLPTQFLAFTVPGVVIGAQVGVWVTRRLAEKEGILGWRPEIMLKVMMSGVIILDGLVVLVFVR